MAVEATMETTAIPASGFWHKGPHTSGSFVSFLFNTDWKDERGNSRDVAFLGATRSGGKLFDGISCAARCSARARFIMEAPEQNLRRR